jgi:SAM-dependent methyltransferase
MKPLESTSDARRLQGLIHGYRGTALLYGMVKLGLPEAMAVGPRSVTDLASALKLHEVFLQRFLRGLVTIGIVSELADGRVELTAMGKLMLSPSTAAHLIVTVESHLPAWNGLAHSVRTGEKSFDEIFGMTNWERREGNPQLNLAFNTWIGGGTAVGMKDIVDFLALPATGVVADVGGGNGTLLTEILQRHPALQGTLAEQPHLRDQANQTFSHARLSERATFTVCNFFNPLPFSADAIVLKSVLHDWDDAACVKLLGHCRQALLPHGQIYIVERILPERPLDAPFTVMLDLQMMAVTGGQERTEGAYRTLLQSANLRLDSVKKTQSGFAVLSASVC